MQPAPRRRGASPCNDECKLTECGDGVIDVGEQCDTSGQSATCNFNCSNAMCGDGIVNSSFVVNPLHASDTTATEQCDPGTGTTGNLQRASSSSPSCDRDCTFARCGDGYENGLAGEQCDDVYVASGPKPHTEDCDADCTAPACGDGTVNPEFSVNRPGNDDGGEECDPGSGIDTATCDDDCSVPRCGDGHLNLAAGEQCEEDFVPKGQTPQTTADCDSDCTFAYCGDGRVNDQFLIQLLGYPDPTDTCGPGGFCLHEQCDPGNPNAPAGPLPDDPQVAPQDSEYCDRDCSTPRCGDGHRNAAADEECDPDYYFPNEAVPDTPDCNRTCTLRRCGDGHVNTAVEHCDPGTLANPVATDDVDLASADSSTCNRDCSDAECGDGYVNTAAGEDCDDQDGDNNDGCRNDCTVVCGDGNLWTSGPAAEECDDGNTTDGDGCDSNCNIEGP